MVDMWFLWTLVRVRLHRLQKATISKIRKRMPVYIRVVLSKKKYEQLKLDQDFINSIQLARLYNAIRAAERNYLRIPDKGNLPDTRDMVEFQYMYAATVYEALCSLLGMGGSLKHLSAWQNSSHLTKQLYREKDGNGYFQKVLGRIRNKVVFHFDRKAVQDAFSILKVGEIVDLVVARANYTHEMVMPLVSDLVLNYVLEADTRPIETSDKHDHLMKHTIFLAERVCTLAERCILEIWSKHATKVRSALFPGARLYVQNQ